MRRNPERLAWTVLLISLFVCIALAVAIPLAVRSFINDTVETASITLETQVGVALVDQPGLNATTGVTDEPKDLPEGSIIHNEQNTQALLTIRASRGGAVLLTAHIYGSAELKILQVQSPRYSQSVQPRHVSLAINRGQVRVDVAGNLDRALETHIELLQLSASSVPSATADLEAGSYSFDVSNTEMQLKVQAGTATVRAQGAVLVLNSSQRTQVLPGKPPEGLLPPETNLIVNGDFSSTQPLSSTWDMTGTVDLSHPNGPLGTVTVVSDLNGNAALFQRTGTYQAQTDLTQIIQDGTVKGFRSLKLRFTVQIDYQDVALCGAQGSECPMMVQLDYQDIDGNNHSYFQGFYADPDPGGGNPTYCILCGTRTEHIHIPQGVPWPFETGNLMTSLSLAQITRITFYASGHSYRSSISNIELLAEK